MSSKVAVRAEDISRAAVGIYETGFVFARQEQFQPRKGTLIYALWQGKKLTLRHQRAWRHFTEDLHNAHGKSGPITSGYSEGGSNRNPGEFKVPTAYVNTEYKRLERLVAKLNKDELTLLRDLIGDELQQKGLLTAELIGFHRNGYRSEDQARAAGVANVCCLLTALANYYDLSRE